MKLIDFMLQDDSLTNNGAITHTTSLNKVLDMFFIAGASRNMEEDSIIRMFSAAYGEDKELALKCLFWARDCRGGAGERRFFRVCWEWLHTIEPDVTKKLGIYVPEFGRWDDVFNTNLDMVIIILSNEISGTLHEMFKEKLPLLCKWIPRKGKVFNKIRRELRVTPKFLRKLLVKNTSVVETKMCSNKWSDINYSSVPSVAMHRYRSAFAANDRERFSALIDNVLEGKETLNAGVLFPHVLFQAFEKGQNMRAIQAQWESLPNYMEGFEKGILPVCDVSGSMTGVPMSVSVALGCYISERNEGVFKDAFMTFSSEPRMQKLSGSILQRFTQLRQSDWGYNTNLTATFEMLLKVAVKHNVPQEDMPSQILIISDMEFDTASTGETNFNYIKNEYSRLGFKMPKMVFWNVNGREGNIPAAKDDNVALVSGLSPAILTSVLKGESKTPVELMEDLLNSDRYKNITLK